MIIFLFIPWISKHIKNRLDYVSQSIKKSHFRLKYFRRVSVGEILSVFDASHRILMFISRYGIPIQWANVLHNQNYLVTTCWNLKPLSDYLIRRKITKCPGFDSWYITYFVDVGLRMYLFSYNVVRIFLRYVL